MKALILPHNRGIYPIVTTFFFVIVILFAVLSVIYYGSVILRHKMITNDELSRYELIRDVKNRLYYCYGPVFDKSILNQSICDMGSSLIRGYIITELSYGNCTAMKWTTYDNSYEDSISEVYIVPIRDNGFVCPGSVKILV